MHGLRICSFCRTPHAADDCKSNEVNEKKYLHHTDNHKKIIHCALSHSRLEALHMVYIRAYVARSIFQYIMHWSLENQQLHRSLQMLVALSNLSFNFNSLVILILGAGNTKKMVPWDPRSKAGVISFRVSWHKILKILTEFNPLFPFLLAPPSISIPLYPLHTFWIGKIARFALQELLRVLFLEPKSCQPNGQFGVVLPCWGGGIWFLIGETRWSVCSCSRTNQEIIMIADFWWEKSGDKFVTTRRRW